MSSPCTPTHTTHQVLGRVPQVVHQAGHQEANRQPNAALGRSHAAPRCSWQAPQPIPAPWLLPHLQLYVPRLSRGMRAAATHAHKHTRTHTHKHSLTHSIVLTRRRPLSPSTPWTCWTLCCMLSGSPPTTPLPWEQQRWLPQQWTTWSESLLPGVYPVACTRRIATPHPIAHHPPTQTTAWMC